MQSSWPRGQLQNLLPVAEAISSPPSAQTESWFRMCSVMVQVPFQAG